MLVGKRRYSFPPRAQNSTHADEKRARNGSDGTVQCVSCDDRCDEESRTSADPGVPVAIGGNPTARASDSRADKRSEQSARNTTNSDPALASGATRDRAEKPAESAENSANDKERN